MDDYGTGANNAVRADAGPGAHADACTDISTLPEFATATQMNARPKACEIT